MSRDAKKITSSETFFIRNFFLKHSLETFFLQNLSSGKEQKVLG